MPKLYKKEKSVILPLETWFGNSPEFYRSGKPIDIGSLAETLVYYDTVFLVIKNHDQLGAILEWFMKSDSADSFVRLLEEGSVFFYYYNFYINPIYMAETDAYSLYNIQEAKEDRLQLFNLHVIKSLFPYFNTARRKSRFLSTLEDSVITVEADSFGKSVKNAKELILKRDNYEILLKELFSALKTSGFIDDFPDIEANEGTSLRGDPQIHTNINFEFFKNLIGEKYNFGKHVPLAIAANSNRLLWSAAELETDIYVNNPMLGFLNREVDSEIPNYTNVENNLRKLYISTELPSIRDEVNSGSLTASDILLLRDLGAEFRSWLYNLDQMEIDIIEAFNSDFLEKSGKSFLIKAFKYSQIISDIPGVITAAAMGDVSGAITGSMITGGINFFIKKYLENIKKDWSPKFWGNEIGRFID